MSSEIREALTRFAIHYLSYDYREPPSARLEGLAELVTPGVLEQLATPLPEALAELLVTEQRIVTVQVSSIVGAETLTTGHGVYHLSCETLQSSTAGDAATGVDGSRPAGAAVPTGSPETRTLTVVLGTDLLVEDVR